MPLHVVTSPSSHALWRGFVDRFLAELGDRTGPSGYPAYAWLTHRIQRDRLWREAGGHGHGFGSGGTVDRPGLGRAADQLLGSTGRRRRYWRRRGPAPPCARDWRRCWARRPEGRFPCDSMGQR